MYILILVAVGLLLTEISVRIFFPAPLYKLRNDESEQIVPHPLVSYIYQPNLDFIIHTKNYSTRIEINSYGYRDDAWQPVDSIPSILVVGDSYTAGQGVGVERRYSSQLEYLFDESPEIQIFNAGVSGYGLPQMINTVRIHQPLLSPDIVIMGVYISGLPRISDPFIYHQGFSVRRSQVKHTQVHHHNAYLVLSTSPFLRKIEILLLRFSALYQNIVSRVSGLNYRRIPQPTHLDNLATITPDLAQLAEELTSHGSILLVLTIIQHDKKGNFNVDELNAAQRLSTICDSLDIPLISITYHLEQAVEEGESFRIDENDPHWNDRAHALAAQALYDWITRNRTTSP